MKQTIQITVQIDAEDTLDTLCEALDKALGIDLVSIHHLPPSVYDYTHRELALARLCKRANPNAKIRAIQNFRECTGWPLAQTRHIIEKC